MSKQPTIVSLGSGCDVALAMLEPNGIMEQTHFFDYLWNLDRGLEIVRAIIEEDFAGFSSLDDFVQDFHPEWNTEPDPSGVTLGCGNTNSRQLVHRKYRDLAFIHYQHNQDLIDTLSRKIERFRSILQSTEPVNFVYYRSFEAAIESNYHNAEDYDIEQKLHFFEQETQSFADFLRESHPSLQFNLWSVFLKPLDEIEGVNNKIERFVAQPGEHPHISYRSAKRRGPGCRPAWNLVLEDIRASQSVLFNK